MDLIYSTALDLVARLRRKEISARDIMLATLAQISQTESLVQSFLTLRPPEELLAEADAIDARRANNVDIGPLGGLPVAFKDSICTKGLRTTCASRILANYIPPYDATVVKKIRAADGIILGKTNMDEFAMGASTENSAYHPTRNPHDLNYVPGGTSGGAAAAVAANQVALSLGADTGGSIRQPASFCGVVGLKPTYGAVSRLGLIAYASSFDQIGPLAKTVEDAALLLSIISGFDDHDSTSLPIHPFPASPSRPQPHECRIGIPKEYFGDGLDPEVRDSVLSAIQLLGRDGYDIVEVSLPHTALAVATYYILVLAEASSNLARYDGVRYGWRAPNAPSPHTTIRDTRTIGFGTEVKKRILLGTYILSATYYDAYYRRATSIREMITSELRAVFAQCSIVAHPVAPTAAYKLGTLHDDPLRMYLGDVYSVIANLTKLPAISVPCGRTSTGLPIGIQLTGDHLSDASLIGHAANLQRVLAAHGSWPSDSSQRNS